MRCTKRIGLGLAVCCVAGFVYFPTQGPWQYEPAWAQWPAESSEGEAPKQHSIAGMKHNMGSRSKTVAHPELALGKHRDDQRHFGRGHTHGRGAQHPSAAAAPASASESKAAGTAAVAKKLIEAQPKTCEVPHVVHQTWKDREVQSVFEPRIASWISKNPDWEYRFWTDDDNRELIKTVYPESLAMFDGYHTNIQRADAIRYFILYEYGGVYADLDFEALRPLSQLLESDEMADVGVILGQEPYAHSRVLYDQPRMLCNAIMITCPHHPFWKAVIDELHTRYDAGIKTVRATGPRMLTDVVERWLNTTEGATSASMPHGIQSGGGDGGLAGDAAAIVSGLGRLYIPEPEMFYPQFDDGNARVRETCEQGKCFECKQKDAAGKLIRKDGPLSPRQVRQWQRAASASELEWSEAVLACLL
jgi:hypothetical protein|eukprot:COSAG06_NODE_3311_length_5515_cov_2.949281_4_plen_418_part_00